MRRWRELVAGFEAVAEASSGNGVGWGMGAVRRREGEGGRWIKGGGGGEKEYLGLRESHSCFFIEHESHL